MSESITFADLCDQYAQTIEQIGRLETLPPDYRPDNYPYLLDTLRRYRDTLKTALKLALEQRP